MDAFIFRFLLQCLEDLDQSLRKVNSRLFVIRGQPADVLPKCFKEWGTTCLTFEEDPEPFGRVRDQNIMAQCKELNIDVSVKSSHTLYKLDVIIDKNGGKAPLTYRHFLNVVSYLDPPPQPEPTISLDFMKNSYTPVNINHDDKYGVPSLEELGFDTDNLRDPCWRGGEMEALARLERHLERKAYVATFGRPKMTPQSLMASQTGVSPYLRFGCLSPRLFYYQLDDLYRKIKNAEPPLSLHGQVLWREFFYCAATKNPNFDRMVGNPICVQIPWDKNSKALAKWANAKTGFPWIDAIMTQLREEGWIHHIARHAVACFLTRGDLWISWEEGMKVFEELLLDTDWSVNAGMWMWLSCSSFFQQFIHCYCPVRFGRKADPNGDFIRKYLPVLKMLPTQYIHEPWMAPEAVQKASKCIIGKDYPMPMINHAVAYRINIERMKQVYRSLPKYRPTDIHSFVQGTNNAGTPAPQMPIPLPEPDANFTTLDDSMINTAAANMDMNCDLSTKSLHDLLESAINDTFGTVGTLGS
ncbi:Cryptochrome-1 [Orchesella cincta]|uniref:Cryptochrome-1 n=1 Tax=Orchesella cincta TaxID=48709 RepID=A0A1D2NH55_ORCCI|nr:Cryptochrome-1 [Orchesella cincta]